MYRSRPIIGLGMARSTPLRTIARVIAVSLAAGAAAFALRMSWPWLGQLDQGALRAHLGSADASPFLIAEVGPEVFTRLGLPPGNEEARAIYAELVEKVDRAGAKGVVFDLEFKEPGPPGPNSRLERAIRQSSIPVIVPAIQEFKGTEGSRFAKPPFLPNDSPVYYGSTSGHTELGIADLVGGDEVEPFFHIGVLAAAVALALDPYDDVDWFEGRLTLGTHVVPSDKKGRLLIPESSAPEFLAVDDLLATPEKAQGKVVIVGGVRGTDRHVSPFGTVEGVEFVTRVAAAVSSPAPPPFAPGWASLVVATLLASFGAVSMLGLRPIRATLGLVGAGLVAWFIPGWLGSTLGLTSPVMALLAIGIAVVACVALEGFGLRRRVYGRSEPIDEEATVMFVDLVGSTPLVRELGPVAADRVMGTIVQRLTDAVEGLGAEIERPLGDGVLVHWRGGGAADQVRRCLEAVPVLREAVARAPIPGLPKDFVPMLTFGIEQGHVTGSPVTVRGLPQWMSSGETVHMAARIQSKCGELGYGCLLGPTAGAVAGSDCAVSLGDIELKGFGSVVVFAAR